MTGILATKCIKIPPGLSVCFVYRGFPTVGNLFYCLTLTRCSGSDQGCPHNEPWSFEREWRPSSGRAAVKIDPLCKFQSFKFYLMSGSVIHVQVCVIRLHCLTKLWAHNRKIQSSVHLLGGFFCAWLSLPY